MPEIHFYIYVYFLQEFYFFLLDTMRDGERLIQWQKTCLVYTRTDTHTHADTDTHALLDILLQLTTPHLIQLVIQQQEKAVFLHKVAGYLVFKDTVRLPR